VFRDALKYGAVLIGTYLALAWATNGGRLLSAGENFVVGTTRALQGR